MLRATWNLLLLIYAVEILIIASSLDNIFPPAQLTFSINPQSLYARHPNLTAAAEFYHISRIDHQYSRNIPIHIYQKYYDILGPEAVLFIMENNTFCNHDRTHNFGRVIYQNIANLVNSVKICRNKCTGGCWHGVLMQYFEGIKDNIANASVSDATNLTNVDVGLYPYFNALCKGSDELAMLISKYYSLGDCYHGLGHAVTYLSEYDPFRAITNCKSIPEKLQSYYCATGAFHEYFLRLDGKRVGDSLLYPCDKTNDFPAACYRTWFLHVSRAVNRDSAYLSLAMICKDMHDDRQRQGCFHGYGLHVSNLALRGVVPLSKLCYLTDERVSQHMCVEGAAGALSMMIPPGSTRVVHMTRMCESLDDRIIQTLCLEAGNEGMNKDPELYYSIGPVSGKDINNSMLSFRLLSAFNHRLSLEEVDEYYSLLGPAAMLSVMEAESVCHDKALVVGRAVYVHTNNFSEARVICGARCSAGCLNGVVVQHFLTWKNRLPVSLREGSNITLFLDALGDRFSQFCAVELANFTTSSCYHSLGYAAFALADADVRLSARYCDALEDHLGAYYCATGEWPWPYFDSKFIVFHSKEDKNESMKGGTVIHCM